VGSMFGSVCLFVCLSVYLQHNSETNDPKVYRLGIRIPWAILEMMWFGLERSKVKVRVRFRVTDRVNDYYTYMVIYTTLFTTSDSRIKQKI